MLWLLALATGCQKEGIIDIPAMDAKVAEVVDVPCRGKIAASDDCDIKPMKTRTKLPEGCIEVIFTQY